MEAMLKSNNWKHWAFTLIEMLIVIFVLGVGILSVVVLITRNISLSWQLHMKNTATLLAREGIELVYNYKNTNSMLWYEWNCAPRISLPLSDSTCQSYFRTGDTWAHRFTIEGIDSAQVTMKQISWPNDFDSLWNASRLYLKPNTHPNFSFASYTHWSGEDTVFARILSFEQMNNIPSNAPFNHHDIHRLNVSVLYKTPTQTGEVSLESFISNPL